MSRNPDTSLGGLEELRALTAAVESSLFRLRGFREVLRDLWRA